MPRNSKPTKPQKPFDCACDYGNAVVISKGVSGTTYVREHRPMCPVIEREARERLAEAERLLEYGDQGRQQMPFPLPDTEVAHEKRIARQEAAVKRLRKEVNKYDKERAFKS